MKLDITEKQNIEFDLQFSGADSDELKPRLVLHENNYSLVFEGKLSKGKCNFSLPILSKVIQSKKMLAEIEVIVENKIYKPWSSDIDIESPINFNIKESNNQSKLDVVFENINVKNVSKMIKVKTPRGLKEYKLLKRGEKEIIVEDNRGKEKTIKIK